ncbi:MAG: hypothetical protein RR346_04090 [Bacteroidales bacterium]
MKKRICILILFQNLLLFLIQAQKIAFAGCDYSQGIVFVMEDNQVVWKHKAPESNDLWVLPNGNLLFTIGKGVLEMTRQNDTVFHYASESAIFACQRLPDGNTFIGECNSGNLLEVSPDGRILKKVCILPKGETDGGFAFMRNARKLANGNYLVAHYGLQVVREYNGRGEIVWESPVPGGPHSVLRLPDGNTLVSVADMTQNPRIVELNKEGTCIWEFSNKDIQGSPLKFLGGMHALEDGKILFANWVGHDNPTDRTDLFLINRDKQVLYTLKGHSDLKTVSSVYMLPDKGNTRQSKSYH